MADPPISYCISSVKNCISCGTVPIRDHFLPSRRCVFQVNPDLSPIGSTWFHRFNSLGNLSQPLFGRELIHEGSSYEWHKS